MKILSLPPETVALASVVPVIVWPVASGVVGPTNLVKILDSSLLCASTSVIENSDSFEVEFSEWPLS